MANNTVIKLLVVVAVVAAGYFGTTLYFRPTVTVVKATGGRVAKAVPVQIKVRATLSLELKTESTGQIMNDLEDGKAVSADDVLVQIDTRQKKIEIEKLENSIQRDKDLEAVNERGRKNTLARAEKDLADKRFDFEHQNLAPNAFKLLEEQLDALKDRQETDRILARSRLADGDIDLQTRNLELDKMTIKAPFVGTLTNLQAPKGTLVSPGQTIATLISNTRVVEARIAEENMTDVVSGQKVRVWFTGIAGDFHGTVKKILPAQDAQTLRYIAYLELTDIDPARLDKTGLTGQGLIIIDEKQAKVTVPERALFKNQLYVVKDGRIEIRNPKPGYSSESVVEILSGLEPGEEVVVDRQDLLTVGERVQTKEEPAAKAK